MNETMREVKNLMAMASNHLATERVADDRKALDEMRLAINLLIGLVEGHRHSFKTLGGETVYCEYTGPMQAMEGR